MESLRKERCVARRLFSKAKNDYEANLERVESTNIDDLTAAFGKLQLRAEALFNVDERVKEQWLNTVEATEEEIFEDIVTGDKYQSEWERIKVHYDNASRKSERVKQSVNGSDVSTVKSVKSQHGCENSICSSACQARRFRLPKFELRKFDGNTKNWIGFWCQFQKIDSDDTIDDGDKFQYLYQCTVPDSPARELVDSFPPSGANYKKAIEQLKSRFARDDMLIDIYVRELLNIVLAQAKGNTSYKLGHLYDKLNTQLLALQSLGVTMDKYAALLFPLVESALPESVLRAWERSQVLGEKGDDHLDRLMKFLKREAESEERIQLARSGIASDDSSPSIPAQPTAACLVSTEDTGKKNCCVWCDKASHNSFECYKANKMSYEARREMINKKGACFICLKTGHNSKKCKNFTKCLFCSKRHAVLMCPDIKMTSQTQNEKSVKVGTSNSNNNVAQNNASTTLLQTFMVNIVNDKKCIKVRAFIDSGAQRSYMRRDIIEDLGLKPVSKETLSHCLFGGVETKKQSFNCYEFNVASEDNQFQCKITALDKATICGYIPRLNFNHELIQELQKHNITLSDVGEGSAPNIGLLIGADYAGALLTDSFIRLDNNLVAMKTKFGWTLQGPIMNACSAMTNVVSANLLLSELWDLETLGIRDPAEIASRAKTDSIIMDQFRDTIKMNNEGRYEVDLPWKLNRGELLDNKPLAEKRLLSTTQRLLKINEFDNYTQVFEDWLREGIIEKVDDEARPKHYLPHHAVIKNASLTTRVRPVFDASARDRNGNSLNSLLEKGVNCLELIPRLLIKFRKHAIGITSDIKKAFLQISLKRDDRQYLSFLWWRTNERKELITYRHCRVVFGITCSPFLLGATINYHLEKYTEEYKDTSKRLKNSFYVDNCVTSLESEQETQTFIEEAKTIMSEAKFDLRGWVTTMSTKEITSEENSVSVLGLIWDVKADQLFCNVNFVNDTALKENITKRSLLSMTQKVFDPVGLACPVTLVPKLIIQKTWNLKLSWDTELPSDLQEEFIEWSKHIHLLNECRIPRRITSDVIKECNNSLHVFSDASKVSFAAAVFLRSECQGRVTVQLVQAKSRVAPVREVTIPRLELMASLIATRLYIQVKEALELLDCRVYFWTDASVAFTWITTEGNWSIFVKNRVKEIREHSNVEDWHHLPGTMNPADLPSRGCNAKQLFKSKWWEGPAWLKAKESEWPKSQINLDEQEVNREKKRAHVILANTTSDISTFLSTLTYFSKYTMIVRTVGWMLRFVYNCKNASDKRKGELTCEEFQSAEKTLLKLVQAEMMTGDMKKTKNLQLFKDEEGLLRIRTKLVLSDEPANFICPIFLPGKHLIIKRLVASKHRMLHHAGPGILMSILRESYWITGIRRLISSTVSKCISCKRQSGRHAETPLAPLPLNRIKPAAVFEVTGIDLAGPLFLRSGGKVWIILFTCAVYRAVHLELTKSLSTEAFLMALRRFIARRGRVKNIYTDNGTNFHGADNLLKSLNWQEIIAYSSVRSIKWQFNPPAAPWWGGWWERLIRSLKELLRRNLGQRTVSYDELSTLLCDCEALMNSRPLTYVADDSDNLKPLTPACFMQGLSVSEVPDLDQIDHDSLNRRLRYIYKLRADLRERFRNEYLGMLIQKGKERDSFLKVGDVVLVETDTKRIKWPLGVIVELYPGQDGRPRVAKVRTADGLYTRPYQRLYPLEVQPHEVS